MEKQQAPQPKDDVLRLKGVNGMETIPSSAGKPSRTKPKPCTLEFPVQKESDIAGGGQPMELPFLIKQIKASIGQNIDMAENIEKGRGNFSEIVSRFNNQALVIDQADQALLNEQIESVERALSDAQTFVEYKEVAIQLGKETLLFILSQKDCEGVRFYFCNSPYGNPSVAAVGVKEFKKNGKSRKVRHPQDKTRKITVGQDIGVHGKHLSILDPKATMDAVILNGEVGPPYRMRQVMGRSKKEDLEEDGFIASVLGIYRDE